jgi:hypothetical protein
VSLNLDSVVKEVSEEESAESSTAVPAEASVLSPEDEVPADDIANTLNLSTAVIGTRTVSGSHVWTKCCVCELDPQWLYILKGDMNRGRTVHNCRRCGQVVCTICSPAGDTINGDGEVSWLFVLLQ